MRLVRQFPKIIAVCLISIQVFGQSSDGASTSIDNASSKALSQTQDLLNNSEARNKAIQGNSRAESADNFVKKATGGNAQTSNEIYGLAADVFANVVKDAHGDPKKMQEEIDKFEKDPSAFAAKWTPEQRAKLKALSQRLPAMSTPQQ